MFEYTKEICSIIKMNEMKRDQGMTIITINITMEYKFVYNFTERLIRRLISEGLGIKCFFPYVTHNKSEFLYRLCVLL